MNDIFKESDGDKGQRCTLNDELHVYQEIYIGLHRPVSYIALYYVILQNHKNQLNQNAA